MENPSKVTEGDNNTPSGGDMPENPDSSPEVISISSDEEDAAQAVCKHSLMYALMFQDSVREENVDEDSRFDTWRGISPSPPPFPEEQYIPPAGAKQYWVFRDSAEKDDSIFIENPMYQYCCVTDYGDICYTSGKKPPIGWTKEECMRGVRDNVR